MWTPSRREEIQRRAIDREARFKGVGHTQRETIQWLIELEKKMRSNERLISIQKEGLEEWLRSIWNSEFGESGAEGFRGISKMQTLNKWTPLEEVQSLEFVVRNWMIWGKHKRNLLNVNSKISEAHSDLFGVRSSELDDSGQVQEKYANSKIREGGRIFDGPASITEADLMVEKSQTP